jgi:hypothetical protein
MKMISRIIVLVVLLTGVVALDYNFDHVITLKKDSFDLNHWESTELPPVGWLQYNITSVDKSSLLSVLVLDYENLVLYENDKTYYVYTEYTIYSTKAAFLNRTLVDMGKRFYIVIENENLISSITVDVVIGFQEKVTDAPPAVNMEWLITTLIIVLAFFVLGGGALVGYCAAQKCKRTGYAVIGPDILSLKETNPNSVERM